MNEHDATETAYKNGYIQGYKDAMVQVIRIIQDEIVKPMTEEKERHE